MQKQQSFFGPHAAKCVVSGVMAMGEGRETRNMCWRLRVVVPDPCRVFCFYWSLERGQIVFLNPHMGHWFVILSPVSAF